MNTYHATPYDITASGFYFSDLKEYEKKAATERNESGHPVEEYEIQFIDGDDCELFAALSVNQATLGQWFSEFEGEYEDDRLTALLYLLEDEGMNGDDAAASVDDVHIFEGTAEDYAEDYLDQCGVLAEVEKAGLNPAYVDCEAMGRDMVLNGEITELRRDGSDYIIQYCG